MLYTLKELQDLFVDACVRDPSGNLMLLSVFGRDGALQQLAAAMHLSITEGGLRHLTLLEPKTRRTAAVASVGDPNRLTRYSGRLPRENLFGNLAQTWIYDPEILKPVRATRSGWVMVEEQSAVSSAQAEGRIWSLVQQLSNVPLLDHWRKAVMAASAASLVTDLNTTSYPVMGRLRAWKVTLPDEFEHTISTLVRARRLTLNAENELAAAA